MSLAAQILLGVLVVLAIVFIWRWMQMERGSNKNPGYANPVIGFVTNFFDTLGIGSFATTTSIFKFLKTTPDEKIPGTLNVGHALPTFVQALIYIKLVQVDPTTLIAMIVASVAGAWLGAGVVTKLPRRAIQVGMGVALLIAAGIFVMSILNENPQGGQALALVGAKFWIGIGVNFVLGALMMLGIGLYAPCLILVSLLGMNPAAAFPIMMGSCAFLMPISGLRFIKSKRYDLRAALGLTLGGIPAVLIAAFLVVSLELAKLRILVVLVVLYAAIYMLWSASKESRAAVPAREAAQ